MNSNIVDLLNVGFIVGVALAICMSILHIISFIIGAILICLYKWSGGKNRTWEDAKNWIKN